MVMVVTIMMMMVIMAINYSKGTVTVYENWEYLNGDGGDDCDDGGNNDDKLQ